MTSRSVFRDAYGDEPFIELARRRRACATCATRTSAGSTRPPRPDGRVLVFAAIDNLWKGAAGQAIQNLNLMLGLGEAEGLR